ncbi:MAG TPA: TraB/GumN family protein [Opitutaceae bacterium]|nr:TraB/GumN family protein [Opitutaceae bacterium]
MRRLASLLGLLAVASPLVAQSSVWKVTRGPNTIYVGGTIHLLRPSDFPLPREFETAFAASGKLFFETDIARMQSPEMMQVIATKGIFTDGTTLEKVLTPAAWRATQAWCERSGLPIEQVSRMRPWFLTLTMALLELQKLGISGEGVDVHFFQRAAAAGKKTGELEPFERHLRFLTELGAGHESEMVAQSVEELDEIPEKLSGMLAAWKNGDLAQLDTLMLQDMRAKHPSIFKELLVDRNKAWVPKLDEMLKTPEVEFVLVGAGHLAGAEGLIAQLRARGCTIEQVRAMPDAKGKK